MFRFIYKIILGVSLAAFVTVTQAGAIKNLESFYTSINSLKAQFTQTVFDDQAQVIDRSDGVMYLSRPGKFRWIYSKPLPQEIICDGHNIWLYDVELAQVTVHPYQKALTGTPAELLAGSGQLKSKYSLQELEAQTNNPYQWVVLKPLNDDTQFTQIAIGFEGNKLKMMRLSDSFERVTELEFVSLNENISIDESLFEFDVPEGVDIIGISESLN